jgi:hypothetical protein
MNRLLVGAEKVSRQSVCGGFASTDRRMTQNKNNAGRSLGEC